MFALVAVTCLIATGLYLFRPRRRPFCTEAEHQHRLDIVIAHLRRRPTGAKLSLHRRTLLSNTIRNATHKSQSDYFSVDLSSFINIIEINAAAGYAICEPGVVFADLLNELLRFGMTTAVVVELPGITVGGAIAGGGLESSSFRHGQFFDSVLEIECLAPDKYECSPVIRSDLFYAISASYNTVALVTKVKLAIQKAPKFVSLKVDRYVDFGSATLALQDTTSDCIEGIAFRRDEIAVITAKHSDTIQTPLRRFSRHYDRWYYKVVRDTNSFTVPYWDYCFRYNYGAFWMADYVLDMLGGDNMLLRALVGSLLDTKHLFSVLHSAKLADLGRMRIIQDLYVPNDHVVDLLNEVDQLIGVYPLWLCPIKGTQSPQYLACNHGSDNFINVGIYGRPRAFPFDAPRLGDGLVRLLIKHRARSMLYAQTWHTPNQFNEIYGDALGRTALVKGIYGSDCFYNLYDKVALTEDEREELSVPFTVPEQAAQKQLVWDIVISKLGS